MNFIWYIKNILIVQFVNTWRQLCIIYIILNQKQNVTNENDEDHNDDEEHDDDDVENSS